MYKFALAERAAFNGDVVTPADADYADSISRWAVNAQRPAKVVAFVKDTSDIALALKYAKAHSLPIAIRGGGHSAAGSSSCADGLIIDLSRYMNGVRIDAEKQVAYVGGGALWEAVDKAAIQHGLATVAGTVNHTGVGGLLLGGGFGWLTAKHGLVIDNLLQATVVTADGSVLMTSSTENSELFFAIRGGGCNFGVATEFVLKLHPQRRTVYAGMIYFHADALEKIIQATNTWYPNVGEKEGMIQIATVSPYGDPCVVLCVFYNGTEAKGRAAYKAFFDIGPVKDETREMPYEEVNSLQNAMAHHGQGVYMKGVAHRRPIYPSIAEAHAKVIDICKNTDFKANILFEYFSLAKASAVPAGVTAFRRDITPAVVALILWKDDSPDNTSKAKQMAHEITEIITRSQEGVTETECLGYSNYDFDAVAAGEEGPAKDKAKLVFGGNYPKLQQIKRRYDPSNIFNRWFPITPAAAAA
ncbi:6-hydroxy-D-nicotine oxidase [Hypsizygus marmoreus]|uniref:6-hydroxy-D-nicotine oxidase n=1 Tax=Hypsizygus marmoreus TaxID=39966 RepID=A0A369KC45_HYPMA|nr:6-hydroxy-D-nicotine oxidase [Hypsizygus marmoreus]